eukprot:Pompholyxophrys_punicea_v1_NODE_576_length_1663_cov_7.763060.p1 type:complete len:156 gc:universal NODE_576_length_1663_cov_7.763060:901-434(-)
MAGKTLDYLIGTILKSKLGDLKLTTKIGAGSYGAVFLAENESGELHAVKCLVKTGLDQDLLRLQQQEVKINHKLRHHHYVTFMEDFIELENYLYLIFEYVDGDDLFKAIEDEIFADPSLIYSTYLQVTNSLQIIFLSLLAFGSCRILPSSWSLPL